ncbi:MAG TPA: helix-turn-helix domain-containing protein [Lacunisphaera sp.]
MQTIGERLEEARKRKGISIREAAETTKIRGDYLQKFEANSFEVDLPPLYVRGFLRSYARYLELDPERLVNDFDALGGRESKPARRENREVYGRVDFSEPARTPEAAEGAATGGGRSAQDQAVMLKFALLGGGALILVIILIVLGRVLFGGSSTKPAANAQPETIATQAATTREATFTITVVEPTRIKVAYSDNSAVFLDGKFALNRGETRTIRYSKELMVTIEYPDRIRIEINGAAKDVPTNKPMSQFRVPFEAPL